MAQNTRQNKLFAAEDYTVVYESYVNANFQAYDYDTIRTTMVDYVRNTYPENYNDWIESSEFVALLDVVAQFGHNLAFRVDLNARNNFLSTATRQDSIFKLADFLGYSPRRNVPAFGEMKVVTVKTNESVIGSEGTSLGGQEIKFDNTVSANNIDDFITVMNAVFQSSNNFGSPKKQVMLDGISTQFYDLNNGANQIKFDVNGFAEGKSVNYNLISVDYDTTTDTITEKNPDPNGSFGVYYKNDGRGLTSNDTGFFVGVKQGTLQFDDFVIENTIDNLTLDINTDNINNSDIWVQTIDTDGNVIKTWTKVSDTASNNVIYNSFAGGVRDIFSVKTRANNQVSIKFPDKTFGTLPTGNIRVWYRVSENSTYTVRPDDLSNKKLSINYQGQDGNFYNAVMTVQLKRSITTATSNETLDSIKENAPKSYAAQDRIITAQDYNSILQSQVSGVKKIKSVNRTFAGHSRYIDFNDPTGQYSSLDIIGKDGVLYKENFLEEMESSVGESSNHLYEKYIKGLLDNDGLVNLYYDKFRKSFEEDKTNRGYNPTLTLDDTFGENGYVWLSTSQNNSTATSGYLISRLPGASTDPARVGKSQSNYLKLFTVGALVKFRTDITNGSESKWAKVTNVFADGLGVDKTGSQAGIPSGLNSSGKGAITLDTVIPNGSVIEIIYPSLSRKFSTKESDIIKTYLKANRSFSLSYSYTTGVWSLTDQKLDTISPVPMVIDPQDQTKTVEKDFTEDTWLIYADYSSKQKTYKFNMRTTHFYMSSSKVSFSNITNEKQLDTYTNKSFRDRVSITGFVGQPLSNLGTFYVYGYNTDADGVTDSSKIILSIIDADNDSRPENPDAFYDIVGNNTLTQGSVGIDNVRFEWEHIANSNEVIDPSFTNIVDVFVLNSGYDTEYRNWLKTNVGDEPLPPSVYSLTKQFDTIKNKKAMSDTVVYKPVKYKPLFGPKSDPKLRAKFRVIKLPNTNFTDNDVKTKCVKAVADYFEINNWDFGETFYFTELAAYVHKQLAGIISSFVIVPQSSNSVFGNMFQVTPNSDEIFIPDVSLTDVDIIANITDENIRIGQ